MESFSHDLTPQNRLNRLPKIVYGNQKKTIETIFSINEYREFGNMKEG